MRFPTNRLLRFGASAPALLFGASLSLARADTPATPVAASFAWKDLSGKQYAPTDTGQSKATVFFFVATQCPIANSYTPRLIALGKEYLPRGVRFFLVDSNSGDSPAAVRRYAKERKFPFPVVKDDGAALADRLGAQTTPQAIILDSTGTVVYTGRIDDNREREKVSRQDAREALEAVLNGKPVAIPGRCHSAAPSSATE